jgi:chaperonin cofactor prefoldin
MKKKIKFFTLTGLANWCSFHPELQNSSSRYQELHNQAQALMQAKKNMKKKIKHFTLIGPAAWCSFKPESQNSSSRYQELHNQAQTLMQAKKNEKENQVFHTYKAS